ncbi:hypothetical protein C5167_008816 [Papaver somniferum]|uniref:Uncharacterized protein n=1 Tax=Papaver somniferum TaxID=3469 RepID=A0A4Y7JVL5_PAPSO|nr:hypothetical protein C5167_008816 [Papaver somniferum]
MSYSVSSSRYSFQQQLLLQPQLDILSSEDGVFGLDLSCPCLLEQLKNLEMRLDYGNLPVLLLKMPLLISLEYYLLIYLCFSTVPFLLLPSKSQEKKRLFHWFNKIIRVRVEDFIRDFSRLLHFH